jgi:hypothetical protein
MRRLYRIFCGAGRARSLLAETKFKRPRPQRLADFRFFPRVSTPAHAILSIQQHRETPNSTKKIPTTRRQPGSTPSHTAQRWLQQPVMSAPTARQAAPVARREPVSDRWYFPPGLPSLMTSSTAVLARYALCAHACMLAGCRGLAPTCTPCILHFVAFCIPAAAAFQNVNATFCIRYPSILHAWRLHPMRCAFLYSCIAATVAFQKVASRTNARFAFHVVYSGLHQRGISHPGSLVFLDRALPCRSMCSSGYAAALYVVAVARVDGACACGLPLDGRHLQDRAS